MAWDKLEGYPAFVGIQPSGRIEWNDAAHAKMHGPCAVELFHDSAGNRLGFRRLLTHQGGPHCLAVRMTTNPDTGIEVHSIEAFQHLANAGVSVAQLYAAALQGPTTVGESGIYGGIWWIELP